ncbi:MAG: DUF4250 domain-containing protein [Clostridia bacterium]|nr:DUF4250 domain-containing protein [Clostridia bacterium]
MLPKDVNILLSVVNTKLRDEYASLSDLCASLDEDEQDVKTRLGEAGWVYDGAANAFVHGARVTDR